jgi:hypothetical protein
VIFLPISFNPPKKATLIDGFLLFFPEKFSPLRLVPVKPLEPAWVFLLVVVALGFCSFLVLSVLPRALGALRAPNGKDVLLENDAPELLFAGTLSPPKELSLGTLLKSVDTKLPPFVARKLVFLYICDFYC